MAKKFTSCFLLTSLSFFLMFCNQSPSSERVQERDSLTTSTAPQSKTEDAVTIAEQSEPDTLKGSLKAVALGKIGSVNLQINYHSPAVRNRVVWGGLVPYDQVWVTGAHSATSLQTDGPIILGGKKIPAGQYALFTLPGEQEWTVILNKKWEQHLADEYSEKEDVVRLSVQPETSQHQERLRYEIRPEGEKNGSILMRWEKLTVSIPISL
ncbi:DUF2911 domain-containing protein [Rufibacter immobilis]|uniref:DUF2911 domain-containing protein n=1 Tax=Rufibacter immobilis TaxID=1348778 RepID=A0A3M9N1Y8_9BACT|nr:DUF2911 domain-containing protein [Rufibacter immobilis]RNI31809.1 DUF2911 domain-containing protein [Rufibacter immobilis]